MKNTPTFDTARMREAWEKRQCTLGLHPSLPGGCLCGGYAGEQCCEYAPCRVHKCGKRKGCKCPLPTSILAEVNNPLPGLSGVAFAGAPA